ncbi:MAG TPA: hypothetical protein PKA98_05870 [Acidimicrobiales bacterium]|nr:hypothetical protein [Acidimicrobiales bacterium]
MIRRTPLIAAAVALGLVLASCSSSSGYGDDDSSGGGSTDTTVAAPAADDSAAAPTGASVALAEVDDLGEVLVDAEGFTLYLFAQDDGTTSACSGPCLDSWPPAVADGEPEAGEGVDASLLSVADAAAPDQLVYNGHLLYRFSGDAAPGEANGAAIPSWNAVDADGNAVQAG